MYTEERPWGRFSNLYDEKHTKVKTITVKPSQRLSLQSHARRSETWTVVKGQATVQVDEEFLTLDVGQSVSIPVGAKHRLSNETSELLEIIEVQTGNYFGEDDIVRYEDDYNRA